MNRPEGNLAGKPDALRVLPSMTWPRYVEDEILMGAVTSEREKSTGSLQRAKLEGMTILKNDRKRRGSTRQIGILLEFKGPYAIGKGKG